MVPVAADIAAGVVACFERNFTSAIELLERAGNSSLENRAYGLNRVPAEPYLVEALLQSGKPDEALKLGGELLAHCREHNSRMTLLPWVVFARVHIQAGNATSAKELIDESSELLVETGARTFEPFLHECRAESAQEFECDWTRQDELQKAHDLFLEIGAPGQAERLAQLL